MSKKSCLRCSRYLTCREPSKSASFWCDSYNALGTNTNGLFTGLQLVPDFASDEEQVELRDKQKIVRDSKEEAEDRTYDRKVSAKGKVKVIDPDQPVEDDFIDRAMRDSYDPETNSVRDLRIDDSALPSAANYFNFCEIAGNAIKLPFSRQLWLGYNLLGEFCPRCTPSKYFDIQNVPVDMDPKDLVKKVTLLHRGVCPKCKAQKSKLVLDDELIDYNQLALLSGQRAGKSSTTTTIAAYILHRYLKAPRMSQICRGIQEFTPLTFTFVGITAGRAIKLLWNPFSSIVDSSPWFQEYFDILKTAGAREDKEYFRKSTLFLRFFNKNIDLYPSSPIKRTLRGDTRIFSACDELSWFPYKMVHTGSSEDDSLGEEEDERERANGDEVHQALDASLLTVRTEVLELYKKGINTIPTGLNINISSPQSELDKLSRIYRETVNDPKGTLTLAMRLPTWEISPIYSRDHPIIRAAYVRAPLKAERDYGANPPKLSASVFRLESVKDQFSPARPNTHRIVYTVDHENQRTTGKLVSVIPRSSWAPQILAMDAGISNNSFSLAVGEKTVDNKIIIHTLLELMPRPGTKVDFNLIYLDIIKPLIKETNVVAVGADHFNSIQTLQSIQDDFGTKVVCDQYNTQQRHLLQFQETIESKGLLLPTLEKSVDFIQSVRNYRADLREFPVSHLLLQLITVRMVGNSFEKGEGFTDDLFRACCLLHRMAFWPKVSKHLERSQVVGSPTSSGRYSSIVSGRSLIG